MKSLPGQDWLAAVVVDFEAPGAVERRLLELAADALDRYLAARDVLDRDGVTYTDRFGAPRARPEVAIEHDARLTFLRIVRRLGLDEEEMP
jgi:hypothetical protein